MAVRDDRQQLIDAYEKLTPPEQAILQLLSIIYDGVTKNPLLDCTRHCCLPPFDLKGFTMPGLTALLNRLLAVKLVVKSNNQFRCHPLVVELSSPGGRGSHAPSDPGRSFRSSGYSRATRHQSPRLGQ